MKRPRAVVAAVKTAGVPPRFLLGGAGSLLADAERNICISLQDYATAMLDELETSRHARQRFSIAY